MKVSIIVPVYKAEKVIDRCIESIINQTFSEWELVLVNDGSPDKSGEICEKYAMKDDRINVIHKKNGGVSSARNTGLKFAKGEYITFVDADDYIYPNYLEQLTSSIPSDFIICGFENSDGFVFSPAKESFSCKNNPEALKKIVEIPYYLDTPWAKLFKRDILQNNRLIFDTNLRLSEDTLFCYEYIKYCENVAVISTPLYVYDGLWGGDSKYQLSYDELKYASKRVIEALDALNITFKTNIETRYKCFHISKLKGLFSDYSDKKIYELYVNTHKKIPFDEFMSDGRLSPFVIGLLKTIDILNSGEKKECKKHLNNLKQFFSKPIKAYPTKKQKIFYSILFNFGVEYTFWVMKFVSKFI